ncbi:small-conductance mechanosensitive channel [Bosea psychrotolerans]|uniref:Small-conductance mechanosensitive channel n=2 Tax=Bosea psychrotolerans TaxID=1871628 RepID=A0A2S4M9B3_9HYPH|nr:small-conductance mechanosensitive channel [Bosea psychrotolerans]
MDLAATMNQAAPWSQAATWLSMPLSLLPPWLISLGAFALAVALALLAHRTAFAIVTRLVSGMDLFWRSLVSRTHGPTRFAVITVALGFAASVSPLSEGQAVLIRQVLLVCFVALVGWIAKTALHVWTTVYLRRFKLDADDNLLARKHVTQTRILQRVGDIAIVIVALSAALMTFDGVRQYGVSLLASAGAAGIVVGLALQPVLKNIFAGIQLAVTQPIRIDDALLVEGEWGNVEEITSTYVVMRLWDWRRMILPLSYFIEKPFQNWTRDNAALIGTVMLYLDYETPIDVLRAKVEEIANGSKLWDRRVVNVQVTDFRQSTMEVRILVSAGTSPRAFDLRCEVREKLIAFLQREHPRSLPRLRAETRSSEPTGPANAAIARHAAE